MTWGGTTYYTYPDGFRGKVVQLHDGDSHLARRFKVPADRGLSVGPFSNIPMICERCGARCSSVPGFPLPERCDLCPGGLWPDEASIREDCFSRWLLQLDASWRINLLYEDIGGGG